jgi:hypothetical protein
MISPLILPMPLAILEYSNAPIEKWYDADPRSPLEVQQKFNRLLPKITSTKL